MTDKDYQQRVVQLMVCNDLFRYEDGQYIQMSGVFVPVNDIAQDLVEQSSDGVLHNFTECSERSLKLLGLYFELLSYIWSYLPDHFKKAVHKKDFYLFLKHLQKHYKVVYKFKDRELRNEIRNSLRSQRRGKDNLKGLRLTYKQIENIALEFGKTSMVEYKSIAFGKMTNEGFKVYIKEQLPFIFTYVIGEFFKDEIYDNIIATINEEFERAFTKYGI
jgi:hypothetical protein